MRQVTPGEVCVWLPRGHSKGHARSSCARGPHRAGRGQEEGLPGKGGGTWHEGELGGGREKGLSGSKENKHGTKMQDDAQGQGLHTASRAG